MLDRGYRGSPTANPSNLGGALRKANRTNEKRAYLKSGRYAQANRPVDHRTPLAQFPIERHRTSSLLILPSPSLGEGCEGLARRSGALPELGKGGGPPDREWLSSEQLGGGLIRQLCWECPDAQMRRVRVLTTASLFSPATSEKGHIGLGSQKFRESSQRPFRQRPQFRRL